MRKDAKELSKSQLVAIVENLRSRICRARQGELSVLDPEMYERHLYYQYGLYPLKACEGEAHRNPWIDNCMDCAPRWGFVVDAEKIK